MKKNYCFLVLFMISSNSCIKDEVDIRNSDFQVPVITGFQFSDNQGRNIGTIGIPNNKVFDNSTLNNSDYQLYVFPNPANKISTVLINKPNTTETIYCWVVPAQFDQTLPNYNIENGSLNIMPGGIPLIQHELLSERITESPDSNRLKQISRSEHFSLDTEKLHEGYYRIYVKIGDILLFDNMLIYKSIF